MVQRHELVSVGPTSEPSGAPSKSPMKAPTKAPTFAPTKAPTMALFPSSNILFGVNGTTMSAQETFKRNKCVAWNYAVTLWPVGTPSKSQLSIMSSNVGCVYVSLEVSMTSIFASVLNSPVGFAIESANVTTHMKVVGGIASYNTWEDNIVIIDATHYITKTWTSNQLVIFATQE